MSRKKRRCAEPRQQSGRPVGRPPASCPQQSHSSGMCAGCIWLPTLT
jgi:hypothetical protein